MSSHKRRNIFVEGAISAAFIADAIQKHNTNHEIGAHSIFLGQIRADVINGKAVTAIDYTTYEEMALEKMNEIRESIFSKFELSCMHIHHSLGAVNVGEVCLFVFTSSRHRKVAMVACEELVERIKAELPVWGREIFEDQSHQWKINK